MATLREALARNRAAVLVVAGDHRNPLVYRARRDGERVRIIRGGTGADPVEVCPLAAEVLGYLPGWEGTR